MKAWTIYTIHDITESDGSDFALVTLINEFASRFHLQAPMDAESYIELEGENSPPIEGED